MWEQLHEAAVEEEEEEEEEEVMTLAWVSLGTRAGGW
jgi:hypothetical protein